MPVVCSYCHQPFPKLPGDDRVVSHGICDACDRHLERLWGGITLGEYLDELPEPIVFVDADVRVAAINRAASILLGRSGGEVRGLLGGEALGCRFAREAGACGSAEPCRECALRRTIATVATTGLPARGVRACLNTDRGPREIEMDVEPVSSLFRITLLEPRDP